MYVTDQFIYNDHFRVKKLHLCTLMHLPAVIIRLVIFKNFLMVVSYSTKNFLKMDLVPISQGQGPLPSL